MLVMFEKLSKNFEVSYRAPTRPSTKKGLSPGEYANWEAGIENEIENDYKEGQSENEVGGDIVFVKGSQGARMY
jgi:hypothetical protein